MVSNPVTEARSKHIDIKWHSIQELVSNKIIELFFIEGAQNPADMLIKNLGQIKFNLFRSQLGLVIYSGSKNCPNVCMFCTKLNTLWQDPNLIQIYECMK